MKGTAIAIIVGVVVLIILVALGFAAYYYFAIRCVADKEGGTGCTRNCECKTNMCALESGDVAAQMVCCSVGTTTIGTKNYCTGLPNGKACLTSAMCTSGVCTNGICSVPQGPTGPTGPTGSTGSTGPPFPNPTPQPNPVPPTPTPAAPGGINTTCTADAICAAGLFCGRFYPSLTAPLVCCPIATGQSAIGFGNFCGNVPDDLPCIESDPQLCAAGVCKIVFRDGNASVVCGAP